MKNANILGISISMLIVLLLTSCEKSLSIDLPDHDRKLVINAIQHQDSSFIIHISKSYGFQESTSEGGLLIDDASVELWEGTSLLDEFVFRDTLVNPYWQWNPDDPADLRLGHYFSPKNQKVEAGKEYELRVNHAELGQAIGKMTLPEPDVPVSLAFFPDTIAVTDIDGYTHESVVVRVTLPDAAKNGLYYTVRVKGILHAIIPGTTDTLLSDTTIYYLEGALNTWSPTSAEYSGSNWIGSDERRVMDFALGGGIKQALLVNGQEVPLRPTVVEIDLMVADKATYQYLNGIEKQRNSDPGNPFYPSEAIVVPSNIDNAYGVFGGIVTKQYVID